MPGMSFTNDDLDKCIRLAHIFIKEEKKPQYLEQMQAILEEVKTLESLDLDTVKPSYTAIEQAHYQRDDVAKNANFDLSKNAPDWEDGGFSVPQILKS